MHNTISSFHNNKTIFVTTEEKRENFCRTFSRKISFSNRNCALDFNMLYENAEEKEYNDGKEHTQVKKKKAIKRSEKATKGRKSSRG